MPKLDTRTMGRESCFLKQKNTTRKKRMLGKYSPEGTSGRILHNVRITVVFQMHPHKHEVAGKRHDVD
jgi:hypothetical protein